MKRQPFSPAILRHAVVVADPDSCRGPGDDPGHGVSCGRPHRPVSMVAAAACVALLLVLNAGGPVHAATTHAAAREAPAPGAASVALRHPQNPQNPIPAPGPARVAVAEADRDDPARFFPQFPVGSPPQQASREGDMTPAGPLYLADSRSSVRDPHHPPGRVMPRPPISTQRPPLFEPPVTIESQRSGRFPPRDTQRDGRSSSPGAGRDGRRHRGPEGQGSQRSGRPGSPHFRNHARDVPGRVWVIGPSGTTQRTAPQEAPQPAPVAPPAEPQAVEPPPQRDIVHDGRAAVDIRSMRADPERLLVRPGTEVVWTSHDFMPHTIESVADGPLDSGVLQWNGEYRHVFEERGVYEYRCRFHPELRGTVEVVGGRR